MADDVGKPDDAVVMADPQPTPAFPAFPAADTGAAEVALEEKKKRKKRSQESAERNRIMAKLNRDKKKKELYELELRAATMDRM